MLVMRRFLVVIPLAVGASSVVASALGAGLPSYSNGPPAGHTGGFGEPNCRVCHWENELNEVGGTLILEGLPERIEPGERYVLTVALVHPDLRSAGFQLSARFESGDLAGQDAGTLDPGPSQSVARSASLAASYLQHTVEGTSVDEAGRASWRFEWVAPGSGSGPIRFHIAANAANGDRSELGDRVYTWEGSAVLP